MRLDAGVTAKKEGGICLVRRHALRRDGKGGIVMIVQHNSVGSLVCPVKLIAKQMQQQMLEPGIELCLGRNCMLWRWLNPDKDKNEDYGYCGLGGIPVTDKKGRS